MKVPKRGKSHCHVSYEYTSHYSKLQHPNIQDSQRNTRALNTTKSLKLRKIYSRIQSLHIDNITFMEALSGMSEGKTNGQEQAQKGGRKPKVQPCQIHPYTRSPRGHRQVCSLQEAEGLLMEEMAPLSHSYHRNSH